MRKGFFTLTGITLTCFLLFTISSACQNQDLNIQTTANVDSEKTPQSQTSQAASNPGSLAQFVPELLPFQNSYLQKLNLAQGFTVQVFTEGLTDPRMMEVDDQGNVYVTQPETGTVIRLKDTDNDGQADIKETVASGLNGVHGIEINKNLMYLVTPRKAYTAKIQENGKLDTPTMVINDLPVGGRHPKRSIEFGPDDKLYLSIGSTCNACQEADNESATILRVDPISFEREIFATGLRNTIGFDWHPVTGDMWGMDIGSDWVGANEPPEELNKLNYGGNYGWPWCFGDKQIDPNMKSKSAGIDISAFCQNTLSPELTYQAHSSPINMVFYTGENFPPEYKNDVFVTFRGSWNRQPPVGYKVGRIIFENGKPVKIEDFMTGFLLEDGKSQFARLAGLTIMPDGSLLVSDDENGIIYRVSYTGK
jgi:glucose/arabinose dehydrogenase